MKAGPLQILSISFWVAVRYCCGVHVRAAFGVPEVVCIHILALSLTFPARATVLHACLGAATGAPQDQATSIHAGHGSSIVFQDQLSQTTAALFL